MRFTVVRDLSELSDQAADVPIAAPPPRFYAIVERAGLYAVPVVLLVWFLSMTHADPWFDQLGERSVISVAVYAFLSFAIAIIVTIVIHEILHLLALPTRMFHESTVAGIYVTSRVWWSMPFVRLGGRLTRAQFVWTSLLPFLVLTVVPLFVHVLGYPLPFIVGFIAAVNANFSAIDVAHAVLILRGGPPSEIIRRE